VLADAKAFPHPPSYLNDVCADPAGNAVYVNDMGASSAMRDSHGNLWPVDSPQAAAIPVIGRTYRVTLDGKVTEAVAPRPEMLNPNGVTAPDADTLLIAEFFKGNLIEVRGGNFRVLNSGFRGADGIERDRHGNLYVSSWSQGKVWKLDPSGKDPQVVIEGLQSAADFYLDEANGRLLLPDMKAGTVLFVPLPE